MPTRKHRTRAGKRTKRAMSIRLYWKRRKGLLSNPNDKKNRPTADNQDLKYLCSVKTEAADIKQEIADYEDLHHEIHIKEDLDRVPASTEALNNVVFRSVSTENGNYLQEPLRMHNSEKQFTCKICDYKTANKDYLLLHKKIHKVKKPFKCHDCDFITDRKSDLIGHLNV